MFDRIRSNKQLKLEIALTLAMIAFAIMASSLGFWDAGHLLITKIAKGKLAASGKQLLFLSTIGFLVYGGLVYQFCRLMYLVRRLRHVAATASDLAPLFAEPAPPVVILVPSYREEDSVILQTLFSACAQDYRPLHRFERSDG